MGKYLDYFPKVSFDISGKKPSEYQTATNIFFRLQVIREVLENVSAYYEHTIGEGDTPEILAEKVYNDTQAHWIILYANNMVDPQYDWPLDYKSFDNYIVNKYGSIATAKTQIHHYEKVIRREESLTGLITETRFQINFQQITQNEPDVPYDNYSELPETLVETINMGPGRTVIQVTGKNAVSFYDWEVEENDKKRLIKIIKPEYYSQILNEFNELTKFVNAPFRRRLV